MKFEWDENKNQVNILKHGIAFEDAALVLLGPCLTNNSSGNYGEDRLVSVGIFKEVLIVVVFTYRPSTTRIISARRANRMERFRYYEHFKEKA